MFRPILFGLLSLYIGAGTVFAQAEDAAALFDQQKWAEAVTAYGNLVEAEPNNPVNWFRLGYAEHANGNPAGAIDPYLRADQLGFAPGLTRYNLACAYALTDNLDKGFEWIEKAVEGGFSQSGALSTDPDLEKLRSDSRWPEFMDRMDRKFRPCEFDERCRQLDFWVGDWNVHLVSSGGRAGTSKIEKLENGCLIRESWSSVYGSTGTSVSFFDPATNKWTQTWTNDHGNVNHFSGELVDGAMHLEGMNYPYNSEPFPIRMTLTPNPDGTVHHFTEVSNDSGKTWEVRFDAVYRKATEE